MAERLASHMVFYYIYLSPISRSPSEPLIPSRASARAFFPIDVFAVEQPERFNEEIARETRQSKHPSAIALAVHRGKREGGTKRVGEK